MPLTGKGHEVMAAMEKTYGSDEKDKEVFYASKNKGVITGVDSAVDADVPAVGSDGFVYAAGILFVTPKGKALFVKRGPIGDHAGEWCFPGGKIEEGESAEGAARREAKEEVGYSGEDKVEYLARHRDDAKDVCPPPQPECIDQIAPPPPCSNHLVDFTTFICSVPDEFAVTLDDESTGYAWAPVNEPPQPLHPGVTWALARLNATSELDVARAMSRGELTSPQTYANVTLFDIRITGTGLAYRHEKKDADGKVTQEEEFTWRDPSIYLNDEFLARCNGLPVIWVHPPDKTLNSDEFKERTVGTTFLPYIKGDEVWAIVKIYDDAAIKIMSDNQLSTSPGVVISSADSVSLKTETGETLLIEGVPSLVDHIAICEQGVWDKGGEPKGVSVAQKEVVMTEEEKQRAAEDKARADAEEKKKEEEAAAKAKADAAEAEKKKADEEMPAWASKLMAKIEKLEAKEVKADKKADSEDEEKAKAEKEEAEKKKAEEKAKADAAIPTNLMSRVDALEKAAPKALSDEDYHEMASAQAKADSVYGQHGASAPRFANGEGLMAYRKRLADGMKQHSPAWKGVNIYKLDDAAFQVAEGQIFADSAKAARHPDVPAGTLRQISERLPSGHTMTRFVGDSAVAFAPFIQGANAASFHKPSQN